MIKIVKSLSVIAFVAAVAIGATSSYFSDVEKSVNNTFTAGTIDIELDDADEPFVNCEAYLNQSECEAVTRCKWTTDSSGANGECVQTTEGVTGTWDTPDNWNPGDLWNAWISIHNNGTKNIEQLLFRASSVEDDEGLNPESESEGGGKMSEYIYLWRAEQFIWPSGVYEENPQPVEGGTSVIEAFNEKWKTNTSTNAGAVDAFNAAVKALGVGNNDFTEKEVKAVVGLIQDAFGVSLAYETDLTDNFRRVFDSDGNGKAELDEFDNRNEDGKNCQKNILVNGEILEPSEVKILVLHWKFSEEAGNDLQGDTVKADFEVRAVQDGADDEEVVCGTNPTERAD